MMKRKRSGRAGGRPRTPSPASNDKQPPGASAQQGLFDGLEDSQAFLREVQEHFKDDDTGKFQAFLDLLVAQKRGRVGLPCLISQLKVLFRGHTEMLMLFNEILQPDHKILFKEEVPEVQDLANLYLAKVKARSSPSVYKTFMHILYLYSELALTNDGVDRELEVLFAQSCDLLEEYDCFRPDRAAPVVQSPLHRRHSALEVSELQREQQSERLERMCEAVAKRKRKEKGKGVVIERKQQPPPPPPPKRVSARLSDAANAVGNRRSLRSSVQAHPQGPTRSAIARATPATETQGRSRSRSRAKALENAEYNGRSRCNPSYLMLKPPKNGNSDGNGDGDGVSEREGKSATAKVSVHRSELAKSVLNEECELVPERDSESRTPNPHEEELFKCEMNQYACDLNSKKLEATAETFMNYLLKLQEPNNGELPPIKEFLSAVHKKCIQQLYGGHAHAFMATLEENPAGALPALINRLVLKLEELKSYKTKMTPTWAQVYKNNFHLSLDHLSANERSRMKFQDVNTLLENQ